MDTSNLEYLAWSLTNRAPISEEMHRDLLNALESWLTGESSWSDAFGNPDSVENRRRRRDAALRRYAEMLPRRGAASIIVGELNKIRQGRRQVSPMLRQIDKIYRLPETTRGIQLILKKEI